MDKFLNTLWQALLALILSITLWFLLYGIGRLVAEVFGGNVFAEIAAMTVFIYSLFQLVILIDDLD